MPMTDAEKEQFLKDRPKAERKWMAMYYMLIRGDLRAKRRNGKAYYEYKDKRGNWNEGSPETKFAPDTNYFEIFELQEQLHKSKEQLNTLLEKADKARRAIEASDGNNLAELNEDQEALKIVVTKAVDYEKELSQKVKHLQKDFSEISDYYSKSEIHNMDDCLGHLSHRDIVDIFAEIMSYDGPASRTQLIQRFTLTEREARTLHEKYFNF